MFKRLLAIFLVVVAVSITQAAFSHGNLFLITIDIIIATPIIYWGVYMILYNKNFWEDK